MSDFAVDVRELEDGVNVLALRGVLDKGSSDTLEQVRVPIADLTAELQNRLQA